MSIVNFDDISTIITRMALHMQEWFGRKQDNLSIGSNLTLDSDNNLSAVDTTYVPQNGICEKDGVLMTETTHRYTNEYETPYGGFPKLYGITNTRMHETYPYINLYDFGTNITTSRTACFYMLNNRTRNMYLGIMCMDITSNLTSCINISVQPDDRLRHETYNFNIVICSNGSMDGDCILTSLTWNIISKRTDSRIYIALEVPSWFKGFVEARYTYLVDNDGGDGTAYFYNSETSTYDITTNQSTTIQAMSIPVGDTDRSIVSRYVQTIFDLGTELHDDDYLYYGMTNTMLLNNLRWRMFVQKNKE